MKTWMKILLSVSTTGLLGVVLLFFAYMWVDETFKPWSVTSQSMYPAYENGDIIYVNPNGPKIKSAGYVTNIQGLLSLFFTGLTLTLLLTR
jgi:polysaccharide export outer membrane protein